MRLFEYMAARLPVVASGSEVLQKTIREIGCGVFVREQSAEAFADAVCHLLNKSKELVELGEAGFRAVLERFNWDREKDSLLRLYHELLNS